MGLFDSFRSKPADEPRDKDGIPVEELPDTPAGSLRPASGELPSGEAEFYNPYKGLQSSLDLRGADPTMRTGFKIAQRPEFVFVEEKGVKRRSWSENLTYYTGVGYLGGAAIGGSMGAVQALQSVRGKDGMPAPTLRLYVNRFLNTSGSAGRLYGNSVGVIGLYFAASESLLLNQLERQGVPDAVSTLGAGFFTGALYRIGRGPRPAAVAGLVGAAGASILLAARSFVSGL